MTGKKASSPRVKYDPAIIYYDKTHLTPKGDKWHFKLYWLSDLYIVLMWKGGDTLALAFTDLTTTRHEMDSLIRMIERGATP